MEQELQLCAIFVLACRFAVVPGNGLGPIDGGGGVPPAHYVVYGGLDEGRSGLVVVTEVII